MFMTPEASKTGGSSLRGACAHYRTGSFAEAAQFVAAIAEVAEADGNSPTSTFVPKG